MIDRRDLFRKVTLGLFGPFVALVVLGLPTHVHATAFNDPGSRSATATGTGLVAVNPDIDGGEVSLGSTAQIVTLFRNEGVQPVKVTQVRLYPSSSVSANVSINECLGEALPTGAECAMVVSVKALQAGNWRVEMLVSHDGKSRLLTSSMSGSVSQGESASQQVLSDIETIPEEVDFGSLSSSRPLVKSVILRNIAAESVSVNDIFVQASAQSGYSLDHDCEELAPGAACIATITWSPQQEGQSDGVLVINHSGSTRVVSVPLIGEYSPEDIEMATIFPKAVPGKGLLVSTQEEVNFETGVESESSIAVSLVNVGDAPVEIRSISLSGTDNGLTVMRKGCRVGLVLDPIEACPMTLNWSPVRVGAIIDDILVEHTGARGILVIPVRGESSAAISKDSQSIVEIGGVVQKSYDKTDALAGFVITSHSPQRAIISGPGGSRVVSNGSTITLGGVVWKVQITEAGVNFVSGGDKVTLLFDRSLSTFNNSVSQSGQSSSTGSADSSQ